MRSRLPNGSSGTVPISHEQHGIDYLASKAFENNTINL